MIERFDHVLGHDIEREMKVVKGHGIGLEMRVVNEESAAKRLLE